MKKIILAITPNPALDISGTVQDIRLNEKCHVVDEIRNAGGNAINAGLILKRLHIPTKLSGFIGGSTGMEIQSLLRYQKIVTNFISIKNANRININILNEKDHNQTRFSFPGPRIRYSEKKRLFDLVKVQKNLAFLVLGGSMPASFSAQDLTQLIRLARQKGVPSIVDCPGAILAKILAAKPFFIKPNLEEFQELTGSNASTISAVVKESQKLLSHVDAVCVSSVEDGALLVTHGKVYFGRVPKIKVYSRVGAGDSMVGAMTAQLYKKKYFNDETLRWGLAAAGAKLSQPGTCMPNAAEIRMFLKKTKVEILKL